MENNVLASLVSELQSLVDEGGWECDWTHEYDTSASGGIIYCTGDKPDCGVCERANASSRLELVWATKALQILKDNGIAGLPEAAGYLEDAASDERDWGDNPYWGAVAGKARELANAISEGAKAIRGLEKWAQGIDWTPKSWTRGSPGQNGNPGEISSRLAHDVENALLGVHEEEDLYLNIASELEDVLQEEDKDGIVWDEYSAEPWLQAATAIRGIYDAICVSE